MPCQLRFKGVLLMSQSCGEVLQKNWRVSFTKTHFPCPLILWYRAIPKMWGRQEREQHSNNTPYSVTCLLIRAKDRKVIVEHGFPLVDVVGSAKWVVIQNRVSVSLSKQTNPKGFLKSKFLNLVANTEPNSGALNGQTPKQRHVSKRSVDKLSTTCLY